MSNSLVENRFLKLHKLVLIQLQIQWIKEISNIMHLGFHRVFDLAFLKKEKDQYYAESTALYYGVREADCRDCTCSSDGVFLHGIACYWNRVEL